MSKNPTTASMAPPPAKFAFGSGDGSQSSIFQFTVDKPSTQTIVKEGKCGSAECKSALEASVAHAKTIAVLTAALEKKPSAEQHKAQVAKAVELQKERDAVKAQNEKLAVEVEDLQLVVQRIQAEVKEEATLSNKYKNFYEQVFPKQQEVHLELNSLIQECQGYLKDSEAKVEEQQELLETQEEDLKERGEQISELAHKVQEQQKSLETQEEDLKERGEKITKLANKVQEQQKSLETQKRESQERGEKVTELANKVQEQQRSLQTQKRESQERGKKVTELANKVQEQQRSLQTQKGELQERGEKVTELANKVQEQQKSLQTQKRELQERGKKATELANKVQDMVASEEARVLELAKLRDEVKSKEDHIRYVESANRDAVEAVEKEQGRLRAAQEQFRTSQLANSKLQEENAHYQRLLADANTDAESKQRIIDDATAKWDAAKALNESLVRDRDGAITAQNNAQRDAVGINDQYKLALTKNEALENKIKDQEIELAAAEDVKSQLAVQSTLAASLQDQLSKMVAEELVDKNKAFNPDPDAYRLPAGVKGDLKERTNLDDELAEVGEEIEEQSDEESPQVRIQYVDREVIKEVPVEVIREVPVPSPPGPAPRVLVPGNVVIRYVESNRSYWFKPEHDGLKLVIQYLGIALHLTAPRFVTSWYRGLFRAPPRPDPMGEGNLANIRIPTGVTLTEEEDAIRLQAAYGRMDPIPGEQWQESVHNPADDHKNIQPSTPNTARINNEGIPDLPPAAPSKTPSQPNALVRFLHSTFHPVILPAFWPTVLALLFHLLIYGCIIMGMLAYLERDLWLAANQETRAFLHTFLGKGSGSKMLNGFVGIWGESGFGSRLWWRRVHWSVSLWLGVPKGHRIPG